MNQNMKKALVLFLCVLLVFGGVTLAKYITETDETGFDLVIIPTDLNLDTDGDGIPDLNIDKDGDKLPDLNVDTNDDGKADVNIDIDGDGLADINIDTDGDFIADQDIDTDGDNSPELTITVSGIANATVSEPNAKFTLTPGAAFPAGPPITVTPEDGYKHIGWQVAYTDADGTTTYEMVESLSDYIIPSDFDGVLTVTPSIKVDAEPVLMSGRNFYFSLSSNLARATKVVFTDELVPLTATTFDVSDAADNSIVGYVEGDTIYISGNGDTPIANEDCSRMFFDLDRIRPESIDFRSIDTSHVTNMEFMFSYCNDLNSLDISKFDTSKVTNMNSMFGDCFNLTSLDVKNFNTSKVTDMGSMFKSCRTLTSLDLSKFDTSKVTDMGSMFWDCCSLTNLDLSNFNTRNVTNMSNMFNMYWSGSDLTSLDVSNFDTSKVTDMSEMFKACHSLEVIYVGDKWNTDNVVYSDDLFLSSNSLVGGAGTKYSRPHINAEYARIDSVTAPGYLTYKGESGISYSVHFDGNGNDGGSMRDQNFTYGTAQNLTANGFTKTGYSFEGWSFTEDGDVVYADQASVDKLTGKNGGIVTLYAVWEESSSFTVTYHANGGQFTDGSETNDVVYKKETVTKISKTNNIDDNGVALSPFTEFPNDINTINVYSFSMPGATSLEVSITSDIDMFIYDSSASYEDMKNRSEVGLISSMTPLSLDNATTQNVVVNGDTVYFCVYANDNYDEFYGYYATITSEEIKPDDTYEEPTKSGHTFEGWYTDQNCTDGNEFDTSALTSDMTVYAKWKNSLSDWKYTVDDTTNTITLTSYIGDETKVTLYNNYTVDGTKYSNVVMGEASDSSGPFYDAQSYLTSIAFEDGVKLPSDSSYMFFLCEALTSLDVSGLDTSAVTNMTGMFEGCSNLTSLALSNFDTSQVTDMSSMFRDCNYLKTIYVGDNWNTDNVDSSSDMFYSCTSLVGGAGTTYDGTHTDAEYARVDGGPDSATPGYFTDINNRPGVLMAGSDFNNAIQNNMGNASSIVFTADAIPSGVTTFDLSAAGDNSVVGYVDGDTLYVSGNGDTPIANTDCSWMFARSEFLTSLDASELDTSHVTDMNTMFWNCTDLSSLDVSSFDTSQVTDMFGMFYCCRNLTSLDVSNFDTSQLTNMSGMFAGCKNLTTIYAGDGWNTDNVETDTSMFSDCTSLVGGAGTTYDENHTDKEYARIDGGPDSATPGYFTRSGVLMAGPDFNTAIKNNIGEATNIVFTSDAVPSEVTTFDLSAAGNNSVVGYVDGDTIYVSGNGKAPIANSDCSWMISGPTRISSIDFGSLDTSDVTNMYNFVTGTYVTKLDLSNLDTSNVTNMSNMFSINPYLESLNLSGLDTSKVTDMNRMFYLNSSLTSLDLSSLDTSQVTDMSNMFWYCSNLTSLDVSSFDTSQVTNMRGMFEECSNLTSLDVSSFDTSQVTDMHQMFYNCSSLKTIYVGDNWNTDNVDDSDNMFSNCTSLVGGAGTTFDENHVNIEYARIDGGPDSDTPGYFTDINNRPGVLMAGKAFNTAIKNNIGEATNIVFTSDAVPSEVTTFDLSAAGDHSVVGYVDGDTLYVSGNGKTPIANSDCSRMFAGCKNLTSLDVSNFDTSKVTTMNEMFGSCYDLTSLDLSSFDTSAVTNMTGMFAGCNNLISLDVSNFDTSQVTNMSDMFNYCYDLTSLDLSNFDTSQVTTMRYMFSQCSNLSSLDVSNFDTSQVWNMSYMFEDCRNLTSLDLSSFDTSKVTTIYDMFWNCTSLKTIYVGDNWNTDNVDSSSSMFYGCTKLPNYNSDIVDKTNAHYGTGGYLTYKGTSTATLMLDLNGGDVML